MEILVKFYKKTLIFSFCFCCNFLFSDEENKIRSYFFSPELETLNISDWKRPTFNDYLLIQNHLKERLSAILKMPISSRCFSYDLEGWICYRLGRLKLIDDENNMPTFKIIYFNNDPKKMDKCVICYAGYSQPGARSREYSRGINFIIESLKTFNFDGHFIYRIGGWPNLKKDRLKFADVPYAFKPFLFEEARDLGYKKILWLDTASVPVKSLDPIFNFIEKQGCCFFSENGMIRNLQEKEYIIRSLGITGKKQYRQLLSQVIGLNLNNKQASNLLDRWIQAAEKKVPFLSPDGDQLSFSLLVTALGLLKGELPGAYQIEGTPRNFTLPRNRPMAIIYHQYSFLDPDAVVPKDIFTLNRSFKKETKNTTYNFVTLLLGRLKNLKL